MLAKQSSVGLTYGQILATLVLIGSLITTWVNLNTRLAIVETQVQQLEAGRKTNADAIKSIEGKIDQLKESNQKSLENITNLLLQFHANQKAQK